MCIRDRYQRRVRGISDRFAMPASVLGYDAARGGEFELAALKQHRAESIHEIGLKAGGSRASQLQHKYPIEAGAAATRQSEQMNMIEEQHRAEMMALRREHEISMAAQDVSNPANAAQREALHLREWGLSAIDAIKSEQALEKINQQKAAASARAQAVRSDEARRQVDAEVGQTREHLSSMEQIELSHRERMMRAAEEHARIEHEDKIDVVSQAHKERMDELQAEHQAKLDELAHQHAIRSAALASPSRNADPTVVGGGPAPDLGFGVATQELLWSLGLPDAYTEQHNLHRKLETALRCIAAEKPADPSSWLAQLMM
eukprot:TRINITY_DN13671_c0_g1_i2.p1 TRINITY_DN13671_c0_g1~~TRINITY_DN13671_c0_g1_i2.p1  ORF type:complete len:317 (+),score=89.50 TRINITY_DN13671_c0_g1_i2:135-1085(+)